MVQGCIGFFYIYGWLPMMSQCTSIQTLLKYRTPSTGLSIKKQPDMDSSGIQWSLLLGSSNGQRNLPPESVM